MSERRACGLLAMRRSSFRYASRRPEDAALRERLLGLAGERGRFGYRRLHVLLRREGWTVNHKRVYRLYREAGLSLRWRRRKRRRRPKQGSMPRPTAPGQVWSMDFMQDSLCTGRRFRTLNLLDELTRQCPAIEVDTSISGKRVVQVLEGLGAWCALPEEIIVDNGPEFSGQALSEWAGQKGVTLHFITPGRPMENATIESFNGKFRNECLNAHDFLSLQEARREIEAWRKDYNTARPHSSLGDLTPEEFEQTCLGLRSATPPCGPEPVGNPARNGHTKHMGLS